MGDAKIPIMIVDDTTSIRKMISLFLSNNGYRVIEAENGKRALEIMRDDLPRLILLDISMPVMNGLDTLPHILKIDTKMPVIMVTANDSKENIRAALHNGAFAFISKPISFPDLQRLVNEGLRRRDVAELKEKTADSSRLIAVGEMAGQVAHEVLNPVTAVMTRIEEVAGSLPPPEESGMALIKEIIETWKRHHDQGHLSEYFKQPSGFTQGLTCADEDFNDILGIVNEYLERERKLRDDMVFLEKSIVRVVKIVDSLRRLSRREGNLVQINVNQLVNEALEVQMDILRRRHIQLVQDFDPHAPPIIADFDELIQVISNLVRNSIHAIGKARRAEGGKITVKTGVHDEHVEIRITDNGTGIPENIRDKIFDQTFTTKSASEGTGLGLGISRRLVYKYHGDIKLEWSEVGQGTTFLILFPVKPPKDENTANSN